MAQPSVEAIVVYAMDDHVNLSQDRAASCAKNVTTMFAVVPSELDRSSAVGDGGSGIGGHSLIAEVTSLQKQVAQNVACVQARTGLAMCERAGTVVANSGLHARAGLQAMHIA